MIAAIARTAIQIQQYRRLRVDDYTLIFACVMFVAGSILLFVSLPTVYWITGITLDPLNPTTEKFIFSPDFPYQIAHSQKIVYSYLSLSITAIFSVKVTFIVFFRPMVDKMPNMIMYWKVLFAITLVSYIFSICSQFIECPHFGVSACESFHAQESCDIQNSLLIQYTIVNCVVGHGFTRTLGVSATVIGLDLLTDLMSKLSPILTSWIPGNSSEYPVRHYCNAPLPKSSAHFHMLSPKNCMRSGQRDIYLRIRKGVAESIWF